MLHWTSFVKPIVLLQLIMLLNGYKEMPGDQSSERYQEYKELCDGLTQEVMDRKGHDVHPDRAGNV